MDQPWNYRVDDRRVSNQLVTFHLFCEGENSEPIYFQQFDNDKVKIIAHGNQKSMCKNVFKTIDHCLENGIIYRSESGGYELYEEGIEIWCVFDRDKGGGGTKNSIGDIEFTSALKIVNDSPVKVAWSNDSFDLWILLHVDDSIVDNWDAAKHRTYYFNWLTEYFRNHPAPNELLQRTMQHKTFSYEKDLKHSKKMANIVIPEIIDKTEIAIERAKMLYKLNLEESDEAQKMPCTTIYQLVEKIISLGEISFTTS